MSSRVGSSTLIAVLGAYHLSSIFTSSIVRTGPSLPCTYCFRARRIAVASAAQKAIGTSRPRPSVQSVFVYATHMVRLSVMASYLSSKTPASKRPAQRRKLQTHRRLPIAFVLCRGRSWLFLLHGYVDSIVQLIPREINIHGRLVHPEHNLVMTYVWCA